GRLRRRRGSGKEPAGFLPLVFGLVLAAFAADGGHSVAILAGGLAAFTAGCAGFLGGELVRGPFLVSRLPALAARLPRFLRTELVRGPFQVGGLTALACDFPLLCFIHGSEAPLAAGWPVSPPLTGHCTGIRREVRQARGSLAASD